MSGNDWWNEDVFSLWQKSVRKVDEAGGGKLCSRGQMQQLETNVGRQYLDNKLEPAVSVMRMSANNDDQADQQHELANLGMTKSTFRHSRGFGERKIEEIGLQTFPKHSQ